MIISLDRKLGTHNITARSCISHHNKLVPVQFTVLYLTVLYLTVLYLLKVLGNVNLRVYPCSSRYYIISQEIEMPK